MDRASRLSYPKSKSGWKRPIYESRRKCKSPPSSGAAQPVEARVVFTYDIVWQASEIKWASRWDIYLSMDNAVPDKVHWFSIVNSVLIVLFLTGMIALILASSNCAFVLYSSSSSSSSSSGIPLCSLWVSVVYLYISLYLCLVFVCLF